MTKLCFKTVSVLTILLLLFTGCATTNQQGTSKGEDSKSTSDQKRTRTEGAVLGGILGGVIGLAAGGSHRAVGTLIGAAVGAGAGYLVGNEIAKRKQNYASEEEFLDAEIESTEEFNRTAREYNQTLAAQIEELDRTSAELMSQYDAGLVSRDELESKQEEVRRELARSEEFYNHLKKEYDIKLAIFEEQKKKRDQSSEYIVKLETEVTELRDNLEQLSTESKQLASIDERMTI
jgi:hypothetical protein